VIATHSVNDWETCDRVIYLEEGRILFNDTFDNYRRSKYANVSQNA